MIARPRKTWRRPLRNVASTAALATFALYGGQLLTNPRAPRFRPETAQRLDCQKAPSVAALVYTGTKDRLSTGLDLLNQDKICALHISGVEPAIGATPRALREYLGHFGQPPASLQSVSTDPSPNTDGNARSAVAWLAKHPEVREAVIITSDIHMPRALLLTQRQIKAHNLHIDLEALPVSDQGLSLHASASANCGFIRAWSMEQVKLAATKFGFTQYKSEPETTAQTGQPHPRRTTSTRSRAARPQTADSVRAPGTCGLSF